MLHLIFSVWDSRPSKCVQNLLRFIIAYLLRRNIYSIFFDTSNSCSLSCIFLLLGAAFVPMLGIFDTTDLNSWQLLQLYHSLRFCSHKFHLLLMDLSLTIFSWLTDSQKRNLYPSLTLALFIFFFSTFFCFSNFCFFATLFLF